MYLFCFFPLNQKCSGRAESTLHPVLSWSLPVKFHDTGHLSSLAGDDLDFPTPAAHLTKTTIVHDDAVVGAMPNSAFNWNKVGMHAHIVFFHSWEWRAKRKSENSCWSLLPSSLYPEIRKHTRPKFWDGPQMVRSSNSAFLKINLWLKLHL